MRATRSAVLIPLATTRAARGRRHVTTARSVSALALEHVAYHRTEGRLAPVEGRWTVTHLASGLAIATDLPTQAAARSLALTCERDVTIWPTRDQDGGNGPRGDWANVAPLRDVVRLWRVRNVGGYSLVRA